MKEWKVCIEKSFEGDEDIFKNCDPDFAGASVKELVESVYGKLLDYEKFFPNAVFEKLTVKSEPIGFFFYIPSEKLLVSFGVNKSFRNKVVLQQLFNRICKRLNGGFESFMWERNTRAIKWLERCGMEQVYSPVINTIKLKYIIQ